MNARPDQRSVEALIWRGWYNSPRWRRMRATFLRDNPWCAFCLPERRLATRVDHVEPHKGDEVKFWAGPFQGLCQPHHDAAKQKMESAGYSAECDADGWPTDARHPSNRSRP